MQNDQSKKSEKGPCPKVNDDRQIWKNILIFRKMCDTASAANGKELRNRCEQGVCSERLQLPQCLLHHSCCLSSVWNRLIRQ